MQATGPDPKRFGLWLDKRVTGPAVRPIRSKTSRSTRASRSVRAARRFRSGRTTATRPASSACVCSRIPTSTTKAAKAWDAERYYTDPSYYDSKNLVKPYRVGMSCGFCHVGPSPVNPPADPDNPKWANLSSIVGAQYFWIDRIFDWNPDDAATSSSSCSTRRGPGTLDTSLISADNINNPRTMNAVYLVAAPGRRQATVGQGDARGRRARQQAVQRLRAGRQPARRRTFRRRRPCWTPQVLKDGSDSVGVLGALNRVYLNIGTFSEEWLLHFQPLDRRQDRHADPDQRRAQELRVLRGDRGADVRDGRLPAARRQPATTSRRARAARSTSPNDAALLTRGKVVFAETCARCHSSKLPPPPVPGLDPGRLRRQGLPELLEPLLGLDQDRRIQAEDARDRARARTSSTATTCRPTCGSR